VYEFQRDGHENDRLRLGTRSPFSALAVNGYKNTIPSNHVNWRKDIELHKLTETFGYARFVRAMARWQQTTSREGVPFFDTGHPVTIARAPGRLDVMGGIADYSGSLVLQMPIREATFVAVQSVDAEQFTVTSLPSNTEQSLRTFDVSVRKMCELQANGFGAARKFWASHPHDHWVAYPLGVILVLATDRLLRLNHGWNILIYSEVPEGKGVSSSAALEVALLNAIADRCVSRPDGPQSARICQKAENLVVGAPCGIMDQMTSAVGRSRELLSLLCQPADIRGYVAIPDDLCFWGIDSGIRHAVSGSDYTAVRTGAFMGYRIIADSVGLEVDRAEDQEIMSVSDSLWNGYLANIGVEQWEEELRHRVPLTMDGAEFLDRFGGTTDHVTRVERSRSYAVRQPTAHPIREHCRVKRFARLMTLPATEDSRMELGELMRESHAGYSACGLGSDGTDQLCRLVDKMGTRHGLYGARITGGGSGGTVAILGRQGSEDVIRSIADQYHQASGKLPYVFSGSSPGAHQVTAITRSVREFMHESSSDSVSYGQGCP